MFGGLFAQGPQGIGHQAVIRDAEGNLVTNSTIGIKVSILQGSAEGTAVYSETHTPQSNANGLVTYILGQGAVESGVFAEIDWAAGPYFLKTEADPEGGTNYSISGTTQFLSVPYALHAKTAETVPEGTASGQMQYWNGSEWVTVPSGNEGQVLTFTGGVPTWTDKNAVLNSTTGKIWMDRNLGAAQVAISSTDAAAYGDLYQWGRAADGHQVRISDTTYTFSSSDMPGHGDFIVVELDNNTNGDWRSPKNDNLWQGVSGINNPCPSDYRLPTEAEWEAERQSWNSNDASGAFASILKLPAGAGATPPRVRSPAVSAPTAIIGQPLWMVTCHGA